MALITQTIKNLVAGVSQQPPILRHPEQLEEQINGYSTEAGGLQKRPPTLHKFRIPHNKPLIKPNCYFINRDSYEQYVVVFNGENILVFDLLTGEQKTVNFENERDQRYIQSAYPRRYLKAVTIADYTFVVNLNQEVKMRAEESENIWKTQGVLVNIKSGQYGRTYKIVINSDVVATFETPDGSQASHVKQINTDYIVEQLATQLTDKGFAVSKGTSWLYITKTEEKGVDGEDVIISPSTSLVQEYDILESKRTTNTIVDIMMKSTAKQSISLKNGSIIIKTHTDWNNKALLTEIERCRSDYWDVQQEQINENIKTEEPVSFNTPVNVKYTLTPTYSVIPGAITETVSAINTCEVYDGYNNQAMVCILKATQKFTNLPAAAPDGFTVKIVGEKGSLSDDYYVRYDATEQIWKETLQPGLKLGFDKATMPHVLIRQADGSFLFREGEWTDRTTGDEDSNPEPSFIGYPINDIFFFRNRLGFLSGENIILSSNADFFRFWMSSAMAVQDTDTIDVAVSDNKISTLYQAVPHGEDLIVFSADTQFSLRADGILSPTNVKADTLTYFASEPSVKPVGVGRNIYFTTQRTNFSAVKEYFTAFDNTDKRDAQDITAHVPNYLPNGVYQLVPSTIDNILLFLTEGDPNKIYVYKYLFIDGVKQQSAWSVWDLGAEIIGASFIGSVLHLLIKREGTFCLESLTVSYNTTDFEDEPYRVYVDRKIETPVITEDKYDVVTNTTTIKISDYYDTESMDAGTYIITTAKGVVYLNEDNEVTLQGNFVGQKLIIGVSFNFKAVMSPYIIKQSDDGNTISLNDGRLQLQHVWFNFEDSGYFKVCVNDRDYINSGYFKIIANGVEVEEVSHMKGYDTEKAYIKSLYEFSTGDKLDIVLLKSGILKVPVQKQNTKAVISIESSLPTPIAIVGGGWNGRYVRRFRNV